MLNDDETDVTSVALIGMIAQFVIDEYPLTRVLDALFGNIGTRGMRYPSLIVLGDTRGTATPSAIRRAKSISVLAEVFRLNSNFATEEEEREGQQQQEDGGTDTGQRNNPKHELNVKMADELLSRLGDSELILRSQAAKLFSYMAPDYIIHRLVPQLYHSNPQIRCGPLTV